MKDSGPSAVLEVMVKPRSSRECLERAPDGTLQVRVSAAPVDGCANDAVLKTLASGLKLRRAQLSLERGHSSRRKHVRVTGIGPEELEALVAAALK